jgi:hypothetical protein
VRSVTEDINLYMDSEVIYISNSRINNNSSIDFNRARPSKDNKLLYFLLLQRSVNEMRILEN